MSYEEDLLIGDDLAPDPTTGDLPPIGEGADVNRFLRSLARAHQERARILRTFDEEIERLKRIRDDRVAGPDRLIEKFEAALAAYHAAEYEAAEAAGLPPRKRPTSISLPAGTLTSRAGSTKTVPVPDDSDDYVDLVEFALRYVPDAVVVVPPVPASTKIDYGRLKAACEVGNPDPETRLAVLYVEGVDPETGEVGRFEAPAVRVEIGPRTYRPLPDSI